MSVENKVDKILESIHRIELTQVEMGKDLTRNTDDIEEHIQRTNLLEKKLSKVYAFALVSAGFVAAKYGAEIVKIIGAFI